MSTSTNRLNIQFDIKAIEKDFVFIRFTRECKGGWRGAVQLDKLIGDDFKATAVMFQYGKYAYAMFRKPVDSYKLLSKIKKDKDFADDAVIEVRAKASRNNAGNCICEAWLAQILLNSLSSSKSKYTKFHFCNLTGALLLIPDFGGKKKDYIDVAKISINSDYLLEVKIVRHRKRISVSSECNHANESRLKTLKYALEGPCYVIQESTGSLRRHLPRDGKVDPKSTYVQCGFAGKRASIPFLDFRNLRNFAKCRAGIYHNVLSSVQQMLSKYMTVEFASRKFDQSLDLKNTIMKRPKQLHAKLDGLPLHIVDRVGNEDSAELTATLRDALIPYVTNKKVITTGKNDKEGALIFRIIHEAAYYEDHGLKDEHLSSTTKFQRQHITIEASRSVPSAMVKTLVKEQLVKRDIAQQKLSLFDWSKIEATKTWTFGTSDDKTKQFVFMDISPDGTFDFQRIDGTSLRGHTKYQKYIEYIDQAKNNEWKSNLHFEGLVASEDDDINLIFRSNEISLPNLREIKSIIQEVDDALPEGKRTGIELAALISDFISSNVVSNDRLRSFSLEFKKLGRSEVTKNNFRLQLNQELGKNTKIAAELRNYLLTEHSIRLSFPKQKKSLENLFDSNLNIKYFGETEREAHYFVGERRESIQYSFRNACHFRKIIAVNGSNLIFRQLLRTMDVDFVRTGQSTVVPFPFKYLREYMEFEE